MAGAMVFLFAYLIGSIPTGFLLASLVGIDIRQAGSGNVGATNVARVVGKRLGILTLIADTAKGWIPVFISLQLGLDSITTALVGSAAFVGHLYPVFLKFKGGKGVATAFGVLLGVAPPATGVLIVIFTLMALSSRIVSLSSITTAAATPFVIWAFSYVPAIVLMSGFLAVMVIIRHRDNIARLRAGQRARGASTITQQLAKNLFLNNERTVERKIKEAYLALWLEMNLTKKEILQLYLDRAYMGGGTFGVAAAADFYFGKSVKDVSVAEAAMLAGLFKAPARYAPHINLPAARERANIVLNAMVEAGYMSEGQVLSARIRPATAIDRGKLDSPDYFLDWAFEEVKRVAARMPTHNLVARTTIDMGIQNATEESLEFHLRQHGKDYRVTEGAIVVLDTNGAVRAMVGGRDYGTSQFNRAAKALRQTGSSFKTYVYTTAMEAGFTPETVVSDGPINWAGWAPKNYGRSFAGRVTLINAFARSINTVPVRLAKDHLTTKPIVETAYAMGVESELSLHKTMTLGISGMTALDQATGYLTLANGGFGGARHGIAQLMNYVGDVIYDFDRDAPPPRRVLKEKKVSSMNTMLAAVEIAPSLTSTLRSWRECLASPSHIHQGLPRHS
jgi:acyl-phosphate glycerol 3-phosphate acyltransferase